MTDDLRSLDLDLIWDDCLFNCNNSNHSSLTLLIDFFANLKPNSVDLDSFLSTLRQLFYDLLDNVSLISLIYLIISTLINFSILTIIHFSSVNHHVSFQSQLNSY